MTNNYLILKADELGNGEIIFTQQTETNDAIEMVKCETYKVNNMMEFIKIVDMYKKQFKENINIKYELVSSAGNPLKYGNL